MRMPPEGTTRTGVYRSYFIQSVNQVKLQYINKPSSMSYLIIKNTGIGIIRIRMNIFSSSIHVQSITFMSQ